MPVASRLFLMDWKCLITSDCSDASLCHLLDAFPPTRNLRHLPRPAPQNTQRKPGRGHLLREANGGREPAKAFVALLDNILTEDAFYDRLREGFNDIFLTLGVDGNPDQTVLSYEHFDKTRGWYQKFDPQAHPRQKKTS